MTATSPTVAHHVRGVLFADYVRMIRGRKDIDWRIHLAPDDLPFLVGRIDPAAWYPMATFERFGNAILREIALGDVNAARLWGRLSVDVLWSAQPSLVARHDPVDTLNRFRVLRATYFDFDALEVPTLIEGEALILVRYHMGAIAEEAASHQTMGFFERIVELAGATAVEGRFVERSWRGDPRTLIELTWRPEGGG